jgi:hypothetical protein
MQEIILYHISVCSFLDINVTLLRAICPKTDPDMNALRPRNTTAAIMPRSRDSS